ncbi:AGAP008070-PA, partial [Anopheles gambiae str. PEST]
IDEQLLHGFSENAIDDYYPLDGFLSFDRANEWLTILINKYPSNITTKPLDRSHEGRSIRAVYINRQQEKKIIVVANLHAREWAATSSAIYIIHELIYHANKYPEASQFQWIVVPIANPDGYEYTTTTDRLWRKNRNSPLGIDLNRNFGYKWEVEVNPDDKNPEGDTYRGPSAFSEQESKAIGNLLKEHAQTTILYVDLHTFGETILYPWSFTDEAAPNAAWSRSVAEEGAHIIREKYHEYYTVGTSAHLFERTYGSSLDYCHSVGINVCLWFELTNVGFQIKESDIERFGQEAWAAITAMAVRANQIVDVFYPE